MCFIISASEDKDVRIWDAQTGAMLRVLSGHEDEVNRCAVSPDSRYVISASADKTLKVWEVETGCELQSVEGHTGRVNACAISGDGTLVSASSDRTLKVWDARSWANRLTLFGHTDVVSGCAISVDGDLIASASRDNTVRVWDARLGNCLAILQTDGMLFDCVWLPDGQHLAAVGAAGVYFLRYVQSRETAAVQQGLESVFEPSSS